MSLDYICPFCLQVSSLHIFTPYIIFISMTLPLHASDQWRQRSSSHSLGMKHPTFKSQWVQRVAAASQLSLRPSPRHELSIRGCAWYLCAPVENTLFIASCFGRFPITFEWFTCSGSQPLVLLPQQLLFLFRCCFSLFFPCTLLKCLNEMTEGEELMCKTLHSPYNGGTAQAGN